MRIYDQNKTSPSKTIRLDQGKWKEAEIQPNKIQINQEDRSQEQLLFEIPNQEEKQTILKRIQRITGDTRTHGIEIQKQQISIPNNKEDTSCRKEIVVVVVIFVLSSKVPNIQF